jgi:EH domain-containing protein 1
VQKVHSRGGLPSSPPPRGFTPDDGDDRAGGGGDEEDDWLLPSSSAIAAADGGVVDENDDDDPDEGGGEGPGSVGGGGSPDLSQFDKDVIFNGLKRLYRKKIRPLELSSRYGHFHSPPLMPSDFDSKPMVLLLGQYSVGKTSFIRYLLGRDFPGQRIGPEPTTDRFVAIIKGDSSGGENSGDKIIPGAALCSQADRPFRGLSMFGNNFLSRFEGVEMYDCPILNNITLVDTPGILSGQKQGQYGRNYDYEQVMKWFAERADLIIIMFDAHKLDISDELKRVIELLRPHQDKVRVLLNKADAISTQQLMRVYGALMWSLGKVMLTPEVCRVYMGSFWGAPLKNKEQAALLNREKRDLFDDIARLPQDAVMRRINELVKRARSVKVHAYIMHYLRKQLPYTWGKREKQRRLIDRLDREFVMCARRYELPRGDFPELETFRRALLEMKDISSEVHKLDKKMVKEMERVFSVDIPNLLEAAKFH